MLWVLRLRVLFFRGVDYPSLEIWAVGLCLGLPDGHVQLFGLEGFGVRIF